MDLERRAVPSEQDVDRFPCPCFKVFRRNPAQRHLPALESYLSYFDLSFKQSFGHKEHRYREVRSYEHIKLLKKLLNKRDHCHSCDQRDRDRRVRDDILRVILDPDKAIGTRFHDHINPHIYGICACCDQTRKRDKIILFIFLFPHGYTPVSSLYDLRRIGY